MKKVAVSDYDGDISNDDWVGMKTPTISRCSLQAIYGAIIANLHSITTSFGRMN